MSTDDGALKSILHSENLNEISTDVITEASRLCAFEPSTSNLFSALSDEEVAHFQEKLLEVSIQGRTDNDASLPNDQRAVRALRLLYNAGNRSERVRNILPKNPIPLFRALLRYDGLRVETIALLVQLFEKIHLDCSLQDDYQLLLGELCILWEKNGPERHWTDVFLLKCLETDGSFLAHAFADFSAEHFSALLSVTEALVEADFEVHSNNIQFAVDLVVRILYDFGESSLEKVRQFLYVEWLVTLIRIIGFSALQRRYNYPLESKNLIYAVRQILEAVVEAENMEILATSPESKANGRPPLHHPLLRRELVLNSPNLLTLSNLIREVPRSIKADLKCESIATIGNLATISSVNRIEAGREGGVLLVLACAKLGEDDRPFIVQWCIATLRYLCLGCEENQQELASIDDKPSGIIDRTKLLTELGLEWELDAQGHVRIKRSVK